MSTEHSDILNEVDEFLARLDKLPDNVRQQALQKLSKKVGRGRGRGRVCVARRENPQGELYKDESTPKDPSYIFVDLSKVKTENENEEKKLIEQLSSHFGDEQNVNQKSDWRKGPRKRKKQSLPDSLIVEGRRRSKKVDYRKLAEFGHENENIKIEDEEVDTGPTLPNLEGSLEECFIQKRSRGRPRKYPVSKFNVTGHQPSGYVTSSMQTQGQYDGITARAIIVASKQSTRQFEDENPQFMLEASRDLLDNCLKESGIKATEEEQEPVKMITICEKEDNGAAVIKAENISVDKAGKDLEEDLEVFTINARGWKEKQVDTKKDEEGSSAETVICDSIDKISKLSNKKKIHTPYKCNICGKCYTTKSILKVHKIRHYSKEDLPFKCSNCEFRAASKIELFRHRLKHTKDQFYVCEICGKSFVRDTSLREHILNIHAKATKFKCALCDYETFRKMAMRQHLRSHMPASPAVACPVCNATFKAKQNLRAHLLSHTGAKPFTCDECNKRFMMKNRLVAHKQIVHGPKTHSCSHCKKLFPTQHHLRRHLRIHTGEKPYKCCFCNFSCNTQGNLIKHIRSVHEKYNFTYKDYLQKTGESSNSPVGEDKLQELGEVGEEVAKKLLPTISQQTGTEITLDELKEKVLKEKEAKAANLQEQQSRRKKRIRKVVPSYRIMDYVNGMGKVVVNLGGTSNIITGNGVAPTASTSNRSTAARLSDDTGSGNEEFVAAQSLGNLTDAKYWLTHTDESGNVVIIPYDPSLISESGEDGEEEGWSIRNLGVVQMSQVGSSFDNEIYSGPISVQGDGDNQVPAALVMTSDGNLHTAAVEVGEFPAETCDSVQIRVGLDANNEDQSPSKKATGRTIPESIQIIATNEPVDDGPISPPMILPESGYLVSQEDGMLRFGDDSMVDANLILKHMIQTNKLDGAAEISINKIDPSVYSLMEGDSGERDGSGKTYSESDTFVITTKEDTGQAVNLMPTEDEKQQSLVLVVNEGEVD
ncbi:uncharacterized protein LOC143019490 [Oratosquilla oratoria]|uniref:uncharacterized protein LOC143019490 n=1 Tax=Oratosquilla oratoria TaxID=337810 RepID=UPI003F76301D